MLTVAIFVIVLLIFGGAILRLLAKIFFSALGLTLSVATFAFKLFCIFFGVLAGVIFLILQKILPIAAKYLSTATLWGISALVTVAMAIYAFGRKIFNGESFTEIIEKLIPHENPSRRTDISLLLIELADSIHTDILSKLENPYERILKFFKPLSNE